MSSNKTARGDDIIELVEHKGVVCQFERRILHLQICEKLLGGWRTTPPTDPGWYWVIVPRHYVPGSKYNDIPEVGLVTYDNQLRVTYLGGNSYDITRGSITHWLGPIPMPETPK